MSVVETRCDSACKVVRTYDLDEVVTTISPNVFIVGQVSSAPALLPHKNGHVSSQLSPAQWKLAPTRSHEGLSIEQSGATPNNRGRNCDPFHNAALGHVTFHHPGHVPQ